ncbi:MAG: CPBP family intramembrane metalloprotease [Chloroflexi bacterium]|nr:CPBP family intramembrane metalloprotease [Chloroflexota bacterium]
MQQGRWSRCRGDAGPPLPLGLAVAGMAFTATFRGPRRRFWQRMTATGLTLGAIALAAEPELRRPRARPWDVALGLASAAGLYGIFQVGDLLARRIMPKGSEEIESIYALRGLRPDAELALRLTAVIAPAEELFWRGYVQQRLARGHGAWPGAVLATAWYGAAHLMSGNLTLAAAATIACAYWGALRAAGMSLPAVIVSHIAWDLWIFLIAPTSGGTAESTPSPCGLTGSNNSLLLKRT